MLFPSVQWTNTQANATTQGVSIEREIRARFLPF